jgi:hypothetical protein
MSSCSRPRPAFLGQALAALLLFARHSSAAITSISLSVTASYPSLPTSPLTVPAGAVLRVDYNATLTSGDVGNATLGLLYPYFNGGQFGSEVGFFFTSPDATQSGGHAFIPTSPGWSGSVTLQLAALPLGGLSGFTTGAPPPTGAVLSNPVTFTVQPAVPARSLPHLPSQPYLTMYFETWFTPLNFNWGGPDGQGSGEGIPIIGRYPSVALDSIRTQAMWFIEMNVDVVVVDWTNNLWQIPSWGQRNPNIQELVNATALHAGVYASLRDKEGWDVPQFLLLLGLDNGPVTPLPALLEQLDYIESAYVNNATLGPETFVQLDGKPLVVIFDGGGESLKENITHPAFTLRWMSSQNQDSGLNAKGFWSWMDGVVAPMLTLAPGNPNVVESATLAPAFFAGGGWLDRSSAMGRSGGLTLVQEFANVMVGAGGRDVSFLHSCQWNEYAGQANGAQEYVDSYSPDLSNDLEPQSPWVSGYARPGLVPGSYGYRPMNVYAMVAAAAKNASLVDGDLMVSILSPAVGERSNYTSSSFITLSFVVTRFNASGLGVGVGVGQEGGCCAASPFLTNVSMSVALSVDGYVASMVPPTGNPDLVTVTLDVDTAGPGSTPLDRRFPHVITLTVSESSPGAGDNLTKWPLSFDYFDTDAPLDEQSRVAASATVWVRLPEWGA